MQDERRASNGMTAAGGSWWRRIAYFPYLPAVIMLVVVFVTGIFADVQKRRIAEENLRGQVTEQLSIIRSRIEGKINGNVQLIKGLVAVLETEPDMTQDRFNALGARIFDNVSQIRNIAAARDLVVNLIYPIKGNEKVVGLDYRNQMKQRDGVARVRDTGQTVIVGPIDLVQGGKAIIIRCPVYTKSVPYSGRFWGIVSAVIELDKLYRDTHLTKNEFPIDVAIANSSPEGLYGIPFFGDGKVFRSHPVDMTVDLGQEKWRIAAIPKGGWEKSPPDIWWSRGATVVLGMLLLLPMIWAGRLTAERQRNIADLEHGREELRALSQRLEIAVSSSRIGIWEYDVANGMMYWDERMRALYDAPMDKEYYSYDEWVAMLHPEDAGQAAGRFDASMFVGHTYENRFRAVIGKSGEIRHVRAIGRAYLSPSGRVKVVGVNWNVTEDVRRQEELHEAKQRAERQNVELEQARLLMEYNSLHDALTKLPNRRYLDQVLGRKANGDAAPLTVLHIDLDRFKEINDTLGHAAGDEILKNTAKVLRANLRPEDFVARIGGDEFVIVSEVPGDGNYYHRLSARIIEALAQPILFEGHECRAGASIGVASRTDSRERNDELLINADIALYEAKRKGRNRCEFFTDTLRSSVVHTKQTADEILRGLENKEFLAYFQPQFDAHTLEISGVEALVRWDHPSRGIMPPVTFLKIAENLNVVGTLDQVVLEQALVHFNQWTARDLGIPKVSVNISAQRLHNPNLHERVAALGLTPGTVCFELLESISFDEHDEALISNIHKLKALGIEFEIDDFGTGHASIISLLKLTPRRLKIDRQLISPILTSSTERQLVESIIDIGKACDIEIVAEGVETMEHAALLRELGCDHLQGYAFARPMSASDFLGFAVRREWFDLYDAATRTTRRQRA